MAKIIDPFDSSGQIIDPFDTAPKKPSGLLIKDLSESPILQIVRDATAGLLRGAGSIGSTILWPADKINDMTLDPLPNGQSRNDQRRQQIDEGLQSRGVDTSSMSYPAGKLTAEIAGTAGVGGVLANGARTIPALAKFAPALESGGLEIGDAGKVGAGTLGALHNALVRGAGGAAMGGAQVAMIDPSAAPVGAAIGASVPGAVALGGGAGNVISTILSALSQRAMQSSLKPTTKQLATGQAATAVQTLLDEGINATRGGMEKLRGRVGSINDQIAELIKNSGATVSKQKVLNTLDDTRQQFATQVSPTSDLTAIDSVAGDFANHPMLAGIPNPATAGKSIFVDQAGNVVNDVSIPASPKLRSLLGELKRGGGLSASEVADIGQDGINKAYPGLLRKNGGRTMDSVVEWMGEHGWLSSQDIALAERDGVGGSHELARDMIRTALDKQPVIHPADGDAFYNYSKALQDLSDKGIIKVKIPGSDATVSGGLGAEGDAIPVQLAQQLKQGTYRVLSKKYGQLGSAEIEAQKGLARGLKEGVADAVPEVSALNATESKLLDTLSVVERRVLQDANKNPMGLASLAHHPIGWAMFMADRSAAFKSIAARMANSASKTVEQGQLPNFARQHGLLGAPSVVATSP